jgi:hypothetical protein
MKQIALCCALLALVAGGATAEEPKEGGDKLISGMSIVGNDEAPKSLVIVPWKSSDLGDTLAVPTSLGAGMHPVDREVFMRQVSYYKIRSDAQVLRTAEKK